MGELVASPSIDQQFHRVVQAIEQRLHLLDRLPRVRINAWLKKLKDEVSSNVTWQRNRNCYAKLLLEQLRAGCLEVPFNTMPPEGALPTLPTYLTYRFLSPPKQQLCSYGSLDDSQAYSSAGLFGYDAAGLRHVRPHSAGDTGGLDNHHLVTQGPDPAAHSSWRLQWGQAAAAAVAAADGHAGLSALSPHRGGSPPRLNHVSLQQQQQQWGPRAGSRRRGAYSSASSTGGSPQQQRPRSPGAAGLMDAAAAVAAELEAERGEAERLNSRLRFAEDKILQQEAELVRLQGQASAARRRIKSATAATLQELLDRYGAAAAAGGGGAGGGRGWQQQGGGVGAAGVATGQQQGPNSGSPGLADGVYRPVWQLLSGIQSVLDSCDQQEQDWVRAKGEAAAAAVQACYEAQAAGAAYPWDLAAAVAAAAAAGAGSPQQQVLLQQSDDANEPTAHLQGQQQQQLLRGSSQAASDAAAAAAAEGVVLQQAESCLMQLLQQAEQLSAELGLKKEEATTAAGGRGPSTAVEVAEETAAVLKPMLKRLKHEARDASKLRKRLEAAAEATDAAAAGAARAAATAAQAMQQLQLSMMHGHSSDSSSASDSDGSSSNSSGSSSSSERSRRRRRRRAKRKLHQLQQQLQVADQQQQQQGARLMRLQSATQVLLELDKVSTKLDGQLRESQQRLLHLATATGDAAKGLEATLLPMQHHDNGLVAAATAGIAASLSAGVRAFHTSVGSFARLMQSLRAGATAVAAATTAAAGASPAKNDNARIKQQRRAMRSLGGGQSSPGAADAGVASQDGLYRTISHVDASGNSSSPDQARGASTRLGDAALAGTWAGEHSAAAAADGGMAAVPLLHSPRSAAPLTPQAGAAGHRLLLSQRSSEGLSAGGSAGTYDAAAHYLIGAAAAGAGRSAGGASSGGTITASVRASVGSVSAGGGLSKAAFAEQLHGSFAGSRSTGGGGSAAAAGASSDAAAEAVHSQLAGLSRQASRLSVRASQLLSGGTAGNTEPPAAAAGAGGLLSPGAASGLRVLTGSRSFGLLQGGALGNSSSSTAAISSSGGGQAAAAASGPLLTSSPLSSSFGARSMLSSATRAALLGPGGATNATSPTAAAAAAGGLLLEPAGSSGVLGSSNSSRMSLLRGGRVGVGGPLGGVSSSIGGLGLGGVGGVLSGQSALSKFAAGGVTAGTGSSSSIAAISSRLQSLTSNR